MSADEPEAPEEDFPPIQEVAIVDDKDWFLQSIIDTVINAGIDLGITLTVGGTMISGMLISGKKYFELLGKSVAVPSQSPEDIQNVLANAWSEYKIIYEKPEGAPDDWRAMPASYIHLKEAKVYTPGSSPIPQNGMLWRGRLSSIDGFSLGSFSPTK